jgi:light-regulated signal transduction histidine kinase (bacteriophytochrome)
VYFPALIEDLFVTVRPLAISTDRSSRSSTTASRLKVISDPRRLRQILLNLLSNAIKFGKGKPIHVGSHPRDDGGIVIEVTDQGEGSRRPIRRRSSTSSCSSERHSSPRERGSAADLAPARRDAAGRARGRVRGGEGEHVPTQSSRVVGWTAGARAEARGAE